MQNLVMQNQEKNEYAWVRYIKKRIKDNKNFLALISGQTGTGKSWSALSIGKMIDPSFNINRVIFKAKDLMKLVNSDELKGKKGVFIVWDEAGVDIGNRNWQSMANKMVNWLLQTFRHRNFVLFFTCPYTDFIDAQTRKLFHADFKTISINKVTRKVKLKGKLIQYNPDMKKFYKKYLRVITKTKGVVPIVNWSVIAPDKEFINQYEAKKEAFTDSLNKSIEIDLFFNDRQKKILTESQSLIEDEWNNGNFDLTSISKAIGYSKSYTCELEGYMRRKGYFKENYGYAV